MASLLKVGLTGGIASGKSQVSNLFSSLGIAIIDADEIARALFKDSSPLLSELREKFGPDIFLPNGSLDRKALGKIVFNSKESLYWLNQLTHPLVSEEIDSQLEEVTSSYVILDIPLLINKEGVIPNHLKQRVDRVLVIKTDLETQIKRLCQRDGISEKDALLILDNQSTLKQKLVLADDVIDNNGEIEQLTPQVEDLHQYYLKVSSSLPK